MRALRSISWNYGWDLYRAGKPDDALAQWVLATEGRLLKPSWVPPTLALGLWRADRRFVPTLSNGRAQELMAHWEHAVRQTTAE